MVRPTRGPGRDGGSEKINHQNPRLQREGSGIDLSSFVPKGKPGKYVNVATLLEKFKIPRDKPRSSDISGYIKASVIATMLATGGYFAIPTQKTDCTIAKNKESCTLKKTLSEGELSENYITSFARNFRFLTKGDFVLLDENKNIIMIRKLPENWNSLSDPQKQEFRDAERQELGQKYNILSNENSMQFLTPNGVLNFLNAGDQVSLLDIVQQNATKIVVGDPQNRTREQYITDVFADTTKNPIFNQFAKEYITGLVAGESRFDNESKSNAGAIGVFQLVPEYVIQDPKTKQNLSTNPNNYTVDEVKKSLIKQAEIAKELMRQNFEMLNREYTKKVADQYFNGNEDDAMKYVIAPAVFNAYNTGIGNMKKVLDEFLAKYPNQEAIAKGFNKTYTNNMGADVFYFITRFGLQSKNAKSYGSDSANYVFKSMAMSLALNDNNLQLPTEYISPNVQSTFQQKMNWIMSLFSSDNSKNSSFKIPPRMTKEEFYAPGQDVSPENLQGDYLSIKNLPKRMLPTRIQSLVVNPWLQEFSEKFGLKKAENKNTITGESLQVIEKNFAYRLEGVGSSDDGEKLSGNNDPDYMKMRSEAIRDLLEIQSRLAEKLYEKANLAQNFTPTLVVTSVARDDEYAKKHLHNASENSTHKLGLAFDLRLYKGEIIDKTTGKRIVLTGRDEIIFHRLLRIVLDEMRQEGKIFVNFEGNPPHFHVQSRVEANPNWVPSIPPGSIKHK